MNSTISQRIFQNHHSQTVRTLQPQQQRRQKSSPSQATSTEISSNCTSHSSANRRRSNNPSLIKKCTNSHNSRGPAKLAAIHHHPSRRGKTRAIRARERGYLKRSSLRLRKKKKTRRTGGDGRGLVPPLENYCDPNELPFSIVG